MKFIDLKVVNRMFGIVEFLSLKREVQMKKLVKVQTTAYGIQ